MKCGMMPQQKGNHYLKTTKVSEIVTIEYFPLAGGGTRNLLEPTFGTVSLQSFSSDLSSQSVTPSHL